MIVLGKFDGILICTDLDGTLLNSNREISEENLSSDLINRLNELGINIENSKSERESELAQVSSKGSSLTVFDVINSDAFNIKLKNEVSNIKFNVNFNTGHLEYAVN